MEMATTCIGTAESDLFIPKTDHTCVIWYCGWEKWDTSSNLHM